MTTFGEAVRARRLELGMSQRALSRVVDVSHTTIGNTEAERNTPTLEHAVKIAKALEISLTKLLANVEFAA